MCIMAEIQTTDASEIPESDGVVILNVTLDQLENGNVQLTDDSLLNSSSIQVVDDDQTLLEKLLGEWNLLQLLPALKESGITHRSLVYLSKEDIRDAVSHIGLRAEFRAKLFTWRKTEHNIDDDTITLNSKVASWLERTSADLETSASRSPQSQYSQCKLSKNLSDLLNESIMYSI